VITHYPIPGHRVVSERKLTYAAKIGAGFIIIPKGVHGTVVETDGPKRRLVRFDNGYEVSVPTKHLLRPDLLDRIAIAIAKD